MCSAPLTIGVDLGGTKIAFAVVDRSGRVLKRLSLPSGANDSRDAILNQLTRGIDALNDEEIEEIGVATAGFVDSKRGVIHFAGNLQGWGGFGLGDYLKSLYPEKRIAVSNDANAAALCECWIGRGKDLESFAMVTLGTGFGGAYWNRQKGLLLGEHFQGTEFGHAILYPGGKLCNCGQRGCVEKYCSGTAIEDHYREESGQFVPGREIFERVEKDIAAEKVMKDFQQDLACFFVTLCNVFDPQAILVGGGVIHSRHRWWNGMMKAFREQCNRPGNVEIFPARYLNDAGMIGAARFAMIQREEKDGGKGTVD